MNKIVIDGIVMSTHELDNGTTSVTISCRRRQETKDDIVNVIFDELPDVVTKGIYLHVEGKLKRYSTNKDKLLKIESVGRFQIQKEIPKAPDRNVVRLKGRVVKSPCIRFTKNHNQLMDLSIDADGIYIPCVAFNACVSEFNWLETGSEVIIEGRLQRRVYYSTKRRQYETIMEIAITRLTTVPEQEEGAA